jgi:hypothetical protein
MKASEHMSDSATPFSESRRLEAGLATIAVGGDPDATTGRTR